MTEYQETRLQRPTTRTARLSAIEEVLARHIVTSQSQLASILDEEGIAVTQATLSRDLDEINATKTRLADGTVAYATGVTETGHEPEAAAAQVRERVEQQLTKVLSGLVVSVADARNLVIVHTPSGAAQYVASVIDRQPLDGVLGTIAGDDTVLLVCLDDGRTHEFAQWLLEVASRMR